METRTITRNHPNRIARGTVFCAIICFGPLGCTGGSGRDDSPGVASAEDTAALSDSVYVPEQRDVLPDDSIYHVLTQHEWYSHGEPLRHAGVPYAAAGAPVAASVQAMQHLGQYEGVDYYGMNQQPLDVVYVPVFEGYWQPFHIQLPTPGGE